MTEAGFFEPRRLSPTSLAIVIALHGAAITALALSNTIYVGRKNPPIRVTLLPNPPDPDRIPPKPRADKPNQPAQHYSHPDIPPVIIDTNLASEVKFDPGPTIILPPYTPPGPIEVDRGPELVQAARAKGDVRRLFTADDYPESAVQRQESGSLRARLEIAADGKVSGCSIVNSSGSRALDGAACRVLKSRARFAPAKDSAGRPTSDSYLTPTIVWKLVDA